MWRSTPKGGPNRPPRQTTVGLGAETLYWPRRGPYRYARFRKPPGISL